MKIIISSIAICLSLFLSSGLFSELSAQPKPELLKQISTKHNGIHDHMFQSSLLTTNNDLRNILTNRYRLNLENSSNLIDVANTVFLMGRNNIYHVEVFDLRDPISSTAKQNNDIRKPRLALAVYKCLVENHDIEQKSKENYTACVKKAMDPKNSAPKGFTKKLSRIINGKSKKVAADHQRLYDDYKNLTDDYQKEIFKIILLKSAMRTSDKGFKEVFGVEENAAAPADIETDDLTSLDADTLLDHLSNDTWRFTKNIIRFRNQFHVPIPDGTVHINRSTSYSDCMETTILNSLVMLYKTAKKPGKFHSKFIEFYNENHENFNSDETHLIWAKFLRNNVPNLKVKDSNGWELPAGVGNLKKIYCAVFSLDCTHDYDNLFSELKDTIDSPMSLSFEKDAKDDDLGTISISQGSDVVSKIQIDAGHGKFTNTKSFSLSTKKYSALRDTQAKWNHIAPVIGKKTYHLLTKYSDEDVKIKALLMRTPERISGLLDVFSTMENVNQGIPYWKYTSKSLSDFEEFNLDQVKKYAEFLLEKSEDKEREFDFNGMEEMISRIFELTYPDVARINKDAKLDEFIYQSLLLAGKKDIIVKSDIIEMLGVERALKMGLIVSVLNSYNGYTKWSKFKEFYLNTSKTRGYEIYMKNFIIAKQLNRQFDLNLFINDYELNVKDAGGVSNLENALLVALESGHLDVENLNHVLTKKVILENRSMIKRIGNLKINGSSLKDELRKLDEEKWANVVCLFPEEFLSDLSVGFHDSIDFNQYQDFGFIASLSEKIAEDEICAETVILSPDHLELFLEAIYMELKEIDDLKLENPAQASMWKRNYLLNNYRILKTVKILDPKGKVKHKGQFPIYHAVKNDIEDHGGFKLEVVKVIK